MKILVFDIDGVLYQHNEFNRAIKKIKQFVSERKIQVTFCTGRGKKRAFTLIQQILDSVDLPVIINGGATIIENNEIIYEEFIAKERVRNLIKLKNKIFFKKIKFINAIIHNVPGYIYYDRKNDIHKNKDYYEATVICDKFSDFINLCLNSKIVKITVIFEESVEKNVIDELSNLGFMRCEENTFNCVADNISKLSGIRFLINRCNINESDIVFFGNDVNDYPVFIYKGIDSVYVKNVCDIDSFLLEHASFIVDYDNLNTFLEKYEEV